MFQKNFESITHIRYHLVFRLNIGLDEPKLLGLAIIIAVYASQEMRALPYISIK